MIDDDESENLRHDFSSKLCPRGEKYDALARGERANERI